MFAIVLKREKYRILGLFQLCKILLTPDFKQCQSNLIDFISRKYYIAFRSRDDMSERRKNGTECTNKKVSDGNELVPGRTGRESFCDQTDNF